MLISAASLVMLLCSIRLFPGISHTLILMSHNQ